MSYFYNKLLSGLQFATFLAAGFLILSSCAGEISAIQTQIKSAFLTDKIVSRKDQKGRNRYNPQNMRSLDHFDASKLHRIYAYVSVENFTGEASVEWVRPDGKIFYKRDYYFEGQSDLPVQAGRALISSIRTVHANTFPGKWVTKVYVNGVLSETLPWTLKSESPPELSSTKPSSYGLMAASSAAKFGTNVKISGKGRVFEKGDGKRLVFIGRFEGLEPNKSHIIRFEFFFPSGKHYATVTRVIPASQKSLWAWLQLKLDKKFERYRPSGLWKVKYFVNGHYMDTLETVLHKKDEDPSKYTGSFRTKETKSVGK